MTIRHSDKLKRQRMILKREQKTLRNRYDDLEGDKQPDIIWLRLRLLYIIKEIDVRAAALDMEIEHAEQEERQDGNNTKTGLERIPCGAGRNKTGA